MSGHLIFMLTFSLLVAACAHNPNKDREADRKTVEKELSGEMSLKADRDSLQNLRKEIPTDRQKANDELALYLQLMKQGTEQPQMVRDRFTVLVQKKRTNYREKVRQLRDNYHRSEAKRRDEFLGEQKDKRDSYLKSKRTSEETRKFFAEQDQDRQKFFAEERTRRQAFEAEIDSQGRDFEAYMRDKNNEFNEQYRLYSKAYSERPKEKNAVTGEGGADLRSTPMPPPSNGAPPPVKVIGTED